MTDKGLLLTKILELYPVKAEYVRAILDSHKIDEDGSIKAVGQVLGNNSKVHRE